MKSLLDKVKEVEGEAETLVKQAEETGNVAITTLTTNEAALLEETKNRAETRASAIVSERVAAAKEEANKVKQEREQSLAAIAKLAEENRERAVSFSHEQFKRRFLGA